MIKSIPRAEMVHIFSPEKQLCQYITRNNAFCKSSFTPGDYIDMYLLWQYRNSFAMAFWDFFFFSTSLQPWDFLVVSHQSSNEVWSYSTQVFKTIQGCNVPPSYIYRSYKYKNEDNCTLQLIKNKLSSTKNHLFNWKKLVV